MFLEILKSLANTCQWNNIVFRSTKTCLSSLVEQFYPRSYGLLSSINNTSQCRVSIHTTVNTQKFIKRAYYEEIKNLPNQPNKILIDVREPSEVDATGSIPTSINIPLKSIIQELRIGKAEFESKYKRKKPSEDTEIIFSCLKGIRSLHAAEIVTGLGFKNVKNYEGSWEDWEKREGLIK